MRESLPKIQPGDHGRSYEVMIAFVRSSEHILCIQLIKFIKSDFRPAQPTRVNIIDYFDGGFEEHRILCLENSELANDQ